MICKIRDWFQRVGHGIGFVKARLSEGSTWMLFSAAAAAANALGKPWNYIAMACGIVAAMIPNQRKHDDCPVDDK